MFRAAPQLLGSVVECFSLRRPSNREESGPMRSFGVTNRYRPRRCRRRARSSPRFTCAAGQSGTAPLRRSSVEETQSCPVLPYVQLRPPCELVLELDLNFEIFDDTVPVDTAVPRIGKRERRGEARLDEEGHYRLEFGGIQLIQPHLPPAERL